MLHEGFWQQEFGVFVTSTSHQLTCSCYSISHHSQAASGEAERITQGQSSGESCRCGWLVAKPVLAMK